ncbi:hypothetical protein JRQ81_007423, partial [Phrynocephalus forsythii]
VSELVPSLKKDQSQCSLQMSNLVIEQENVFTIWRSKIDQFGRGHMVQLGKCYLSQICPILATQRYIALKGYTPGFLFQHGHGIPLK